MIERSLVIAVEPGIQADIAAKFVQEANRYVSEVFLEKRGRRINAKSIMGVLSLAIAKGETIILFTDGDDEKQAINALMKLLTTS